MKGLRAGTVFGLEIADAEMFVLYVLGQAKLTNQEDVIRKRLGKGFVICAFGVVGQSWKTSAVAQIV